MSREKRRIAEQISKADEKIKLCVGGTIFMTSKSNLLRFEGSYFHSMLGSGLWQAEQDGAYFIDTNPEHFSRILDYLRTNKLYLDGLDSYQIERLFENLDYFQIPVPEPVMTWKTSDLSENLKLMNEDRTVRQITKNNTGSGWNVCILGIRSTKIYTVRIDNFSDGFLMIGFVPSTLRNYKATGMNCSTCGWYLYTAHMVLYSQDGDNRKEYTTVGLHDGCELSVIHDKENGTIRYVKDQEDLGVAFSNIFDVDLIPAVDFSSVGTQLTFV
eukprot:gene34727-44912_t